MSACCSLYTPVMDAYTLGNPVGCIQNMSTRFPRAAFDENWKTVLEERSETALGMTLHNSHAASTITNSKISSAGDRRMSTRRHSKNMCNVVECVPETTTGVRWPHTYPVDHRSYFVVHYIVSAKSRIVNVTLQFVSCRSRGCERAGMAHVSRRARIPAGCRQYHR